MSRDGGLFISINGEGDVVNLLPCGWLTLGNGYYYYYYQDYRKSFTKNQSVYSSSVFLSPYLNGDLADALQPRTGHHWSSSRSWPCSLVHWLKAKPISSFIAGYYFERRICRPHPAWYSSAVVHPAQAEAASTPPRSLSAETCIVSSPSRSFSLYIPSQSAQIVS